MVCFFLKTKIVNYINNKLNRFHLTYLNSYTCMREYGGV
jgi:hypothetical protein